MQRRILIVSLVIALTSIILIFRPSQPHIPDTTNTPSNLIIIDAADSTAQTPTRFGYNAPLIYGSLKNQIYAYHDSSRYGEEKWVYQFTLPFPFDSLASLSLIKAPLRVAYQKANDSLYHYTVASKAIHATTVTASLHHFRSFPVDSITLRRAENGCFHYNDDKIIYARTPQGYTLARKVIEGSDHTETVQLARYKIDTSSVNRLVETICLYHTQLPTIHDMEFSTNDFKQCRRDILAYQNRDKSQDEYSEIPFARASISREEKNIDYKRLLRAVDRINTISPEALASVLSTPPTMMSTTSHWLEVSVKNSQNELLTITYRYFSPNAFCVPWKIQINGATITSLSPEIKRFIAHVSPSMIPEHNRLPILYDLANALY